MAVINLGELSLLNGAFVVMEIRVVEAATRSAARVEPLGTHIADRPQVIDETRSRVHQQRFRRRTDARDLLTGTRH